MNGNVRRAPPPPNRSTAAPAVSRPSQEALDLTRTNMRDLLMQSNAFQQLPRDRQVKLANELVQIGAYLVEPEGVRPSPARQAALLSNGPLAGGLAEFDQAAQREANFDRVSEIGQSKFKAGAAREGAAVAGALLKAVNFPSFVSGLIKGVFHAIVEANIEQMEAYGKLVADVAKTLNQFRDENVSANQGRDHLIDQFPDLFALNTEPDENGSPQPRARLRDGVDEESALRRVNSSLPIEGGALSSLDDESIEEKLVPAARTQLATGRQQLLATMVLMGISRIVVTDGKIHAKVMYDFQARDNRKFARSAAAFDYAKDQYGNLQKTRGYEGEYEYSREGGERSRDAEGGSEQRDASYYAKGTYKYTEQPVLTAMSTASETSESALQTRASLAGVVEVNFKSDFLPLEKMVTPEQIAQLQLNAQPGRNRPSASQVAGQASGTTTTQTPPATSNEGATQTPAQR